jgi:hypothetical protein
MSLEPIEVTARFSEQGTITPLSFIWNGGHYKVDSIGRQWTDGAGQHVLVMVASERIYELIFLKDEARWFISQSQAGRQVI